MICSVLCCIAAWLDEDRRRHRKNGGQSPIWLVPQLTLWALMAGLAARGLDEFFNQRALEFSDQTATISRAGCQLNKCVKGIGRILNLLCIFYFCSDWFREDLETSRLDLYYKRLAIVGFLNLVVFCFVVAVYGRYLFDQANAHQANNNVVERGMPASQESAAIMNLETTMDQGTIKPSSSSSQAESQHLIHYSSS